MDEDWLKHIDAFVDSYKAVLKEVPTYYKYLESKDPDIRLMSVFAVAWFREEAKNSVINVRNLVKKEKIENILASCLISLSMLDSYLEDKSDANLFRGYFSEPNSSLVRIAAAIALVNILEEEVYLGPIEYLIAQLPSIAEQNLSPFDFPWNDGELLGYVSEVVKFYAAQSPEKVIPALCKVLEKLTSIKALNVTYSLLWIVFPEPPESGAWTLKQLNKNQKMVLKVLADNPNLWKVNEEDFDNFSELMTEYNLPSNITNLKKLLQLDPNTKK